MMQAWVLIYVFDSIYKKTQNIVIETIENHYILTKNKKSSCELLKMVLYVIYIV